MNSETLKCISLNGRGLNTYKKRVILFDWLRDAELDAIFFFTRNPFFQRTRKLL